MTIARTDYATTYCPYSIPSPVQGELTCKTVKRLKNDLCADANSIDTYLVRSDHVSLGLMLTDEEYARVAPGT